VAKQIITVWLLINTTGFLSAQDSNASRMDSINRKLRPNKQILVMFEKFDTTETPVKKYTISRSYYFDRKNRKISYVASDKTEGKNKKGERTIYAFSENQLVTVTIVPPKWECRKCKTEYFYRDGVVTGKIERNYRFDNPERFVADAMWFKSKLPGYLPWGYFQNEVIVSGKMKSKRMY
jgi:hypothetical protein